ncbi:hypothetical protein TUSST3_09310 [Streptomyces sp. TUS-ST3]|uniref:hypothetical protein n=1 Tax=Streptomyces sp. TUS-ST3 TaxID=3025591 RepID=UPI0024E0CD85|nr:hypothetical protein [Streptomyces sp. TUS-ST3]GLP64311.1 hypothetical protein TUSST3_09310 [Streptomyces sp. TUS-ST3]
MSRGSNLPVPTGNYDDYTPTGGVGVGRRVCYALAILGLDVVQRSTIRALLPPGERKMGGSVAQQTQRRKGKAGFVKTNRVSARFQERLNTFEDWGWISKGHILIAVHDRQALLDHALQGQGNLPQRLLDLDRAIAQIRQDQAAAEPDDRLIEQRHKELRALMRLMQAPVTGVNRSGTRSVRFVNRSRVI